MNIKFVNERHCTPLLALKEYGREVRERMVSSELDLSYFQRQMSHALPRSLNSFPRSINPLSC